MNSNSSYLGGLSRRVLLSGLAVAPAVIGPLRSTPASAQGGDPLPSWNDGRAKQAIIDSCRRPRPGQPQVRAPGRAHRHLRPGRHAVGRAPDLFASGLLPGPCAGSGGGEARTQERRAVQDRPLRQPRGDRQAVDARPGEDPRRDAYRHVGRGVQRRSQEVAATAEGPALEAALHRSDLSADAGSHAAICAAMASRPTS